MMQELDSASSRSLEGRGYGNYSISKRHVRVHACTFSLI